MIATRCEISDRELVASVRAGEDSAFEELYRRYQPRIAAYVRRMVRDEARAEDLAQDAFFSALRRLRATDAEIIFKPWIFEIARNAAIDHWRRTSRTEEVSVDEEERLRPADRVRLVGSAAPEAAMIDKERLSHLQGAFDELSDVHARVIVMRELEGMSYREIADRLDLSRASVESALFRARRRLETEYADISEGRRCESMRAVMGRLAEGLSNGRDQGRLARHARRCHTCRRRARELGIEPLAPTRLRDRVAALLPLPLFLRRGDGGFLSGLLGLGPAGAQAGPAVAERAAALAAAVAIGAGGAALGGAALIDGADRDRANPAPAEQREGTAPRPNRAVAPPATTPTRTRTESARRTGDSPARTRKAQPGRRAERRTGPGGGSSREAPAGRSSDPAQPPASPTGGGLPDVPAAPKLPDAPSAPSDGGVRLPEVPNLPVPELPAPPVALPPVNVPPIEAPPALPLDTRPVTDAVSDTLDQVLPE